MMKNRYIRWMTEFLSVIAISYILKTQIVAVYWIIVPILMVMYSKSVEYRMSKTAKQDKVQAQLTLLLKLLAFPPQQNVRCTYHVPTSRRQLRQCFDYIPYGGGNGRSWPSRKGLVGKAFKLKKSFVENFANDQDYRVGMVTDYGYTTDEVQQHSTDRRSYFCHPLIDDHLRVLGIVYFDSVVTNKFPDTTSQFMQELIINLESIRDSITGIAPV
jgi:hypothetical protein